MYKKEAVQGGDYAKAAVLPACRNSLTCFHSLFHVNSMSGLM